MARKPGRYLDPLREILADKLGGSQECFENLSTLLAFHVWSDRMLTLVIFFNLLRAHGMSLEKDPKRLINVVADMGFASRIDLAAALRYIDHGTISGLRELNGLRNRLAHWKVRGPTGKALDDLPELTTDDALRAVIPNCIGAVVGLSAAMDKVDHVAGGS